MSGKASNLSDSKKNPSDNFGDSHLLEKDSTRTTQDIYFSQRRMIMLVCFEREEPRKTTQEHR
ncbi:hypothetical protein V1477_010350 [Vespula maculifrons]|uniref:Uncharacterized protein n=1 Tax=Vespula maculifrons TaxID=7453 RepID=A0ABD2C8H6_VESMC